MKQFFSVALFLAVFWVVMILGYLINPSDLWIIAGSGTTGVAVGIIALLAWRAQRAGSSPSHKLIPVQLQTPSLDFDCENPPCDE